MDIAALITGNLPAGTNLSDEAVRGMAKKIASELGSEFVPKESYRRKAERADALEQELKAAEEKAGQAASWQEQYEEIRAKYDADLAAKQQELEDYKLASETEKLNGQKREVLRRQLRAEGANPGLIELLEKEFDLARLELDGEEIREWETLCTPLKERYADVFGRTEIKPADVAAPPESYSQVMTVEDIRRMSPQEINRNWETVQRTLKEG